MVNRPPPTAFNRKNESDSMPVNLSKADETGRFSSVGAFRQRASVHRLRGQSLFGIALRTGDNGRFFKREGTWKC